MHFWTEDVDPDNAAAPVPVAEPAIGSVVSFQIRHPGNSGRTYDYAAVRAGDGKWYTTGGSAQQGVGWEVFSRAVRERLVGPLVIMRPDRSVFL